jgi:hypothetical protein
MAVADIIVSPVTIYYSLPGTTQPADTVGYGGAWPAGWTALGYTRVPLSVDYTREPVMVEIQESLSEIIRGYGKESMIFETTLAEMTLANLSLAWGGTYSVTSAAAGQPAKEELVGGDDVFPLERQWGFEGLFVSAAGNSHPVRLFVYLGVAEFGGKLEFGHKDAVGLPLRLTTNPDMSKSLGQRLFKWQKVTAPAAS